MSKVNRSKLDEHLRESFEEVDVDKKAFIVLMNGKRIKVRTGKSVWSTSGAAKNAVNNHVSYLHNYAGIYNDSFSDREDRYSATAEAKQAIKEWIEHNIKVVSVGEFENSQAKLKKI